MEKSHSKRHELIFCLVISMVMVLIVNARQKKLKEWNRTSTPVTISKWGMARDPSPKKYSEKVLLKLSEVEMVHNDLY